MHALLPDSLHIATATVTVFMYYNLRGAIETGKPPSKKPS